MHDPESFANERHPFVKRSILEALPTEVFPVSFSPICQRSISLSFVVGEPFMDFVEGTTKTSTVSITATGKPFPSRTTE